MSLRNVGAVAPSPSANPVPTRIAAAESYKIAVYPNPAPFNPCEVVGRIGNALACPAVKMMLAAPMEMIGISLLPRASVTNLNRRLCVSSGEPSSTGIFSMMDPKKSVPNGCDVV